MADQNNEILKFQDSGTDLLPYFHKCHWGMGQVDHRFLEVRMR